MHARLLIEIPGNVDVNKASCRVESVFSDVYTPAIWRSTLIEFSSDATSRHARVYGTTNPLTRALHALPTCCFVRTTFRLSLILSFLCFFLFFFTYAGCLRIFKFLRKIWIKEMLASALNSFYVTHWSLGCSCVTGLLLILNVLQTSMRYVYDKIFSIT